jgi:hypothetical protein
MTFDPAGPIVAPSDTFEPAVPVERDDLGVRAQDNRGVLLDPANQVSRHRLGEPRSTHQHVDSTRHGREEHGGLPG